jgi:WD40 repeat protein
MHIAFSRDGKRLAVAGEWDVRVWDVASGKVLASFQHHIALRSPLGAAFSPDLGTLAVRNYQEIDLWDVAAGKERSTLSEHRGEVGYLMYSSDGRTLLAASIRQVGAQSRYVGDLKLWDVVTGKQQAAFDQQIGAVTAAALSPDGKTVGLLDVSELRGEADLKMLDVGTGRQHAIHPEAEYSFISVMISPEGKLLVVGSSEKSLKLWELVRP